jgi:hypothetical protein
MAIGCCSAQLMPLWTVAGGGRSWSTKPTPPRGTPPESPGSKEGKGLNKQMLLFRSCDPVWLRTRVAPDAGLLQIAGARVACNANSSLAASLGYWNHIKFIVRYYSLLHKRNAILAFRKSKSLNLTKVI